MINEIWKPVKDFEGYYEISNFGRVKSLEKFNSIRGKDRTIGYMRKERILKHTIVSGGYLQVKLFKDTKYKNCHIHRLVAEAFIDNPLNKPFVNHLDCDRSNNYYKNLEWCTQKENINYAQKVNSTYNNRNKKVKQYDNKNNLINVYNSISEASRNTGITIASISYCANKKRKTGGGYIWHFV